MSLCTSIPATRSYITFILLATSCSGNPLPMGTGAPTARAPDQYRRLTHAHAAAAGGTRQGLQRHSLLRPRTVQAVTATAAGTPPQLCTFRPARHHLITAKTPAARGPQRAGGAREPVFVRHGRAAKRRMYSFTEIADPQRLARVADAWPRHAAIGRLGQVCDRDRKSTRLNSSHPSTS